MDLRISSQLRTQQAILNARRVTDQLGKLEAEMGTGNRLLVPSDDPLGQVAVLADNAQIGRIDTYQSNISDARATLNTSVSDLRTASDILSQAKQIAVEGTSSINDPNAFEALASQVDALLNHLLDVANSQGPNGQYLYGGAANTTAPFTVTARNAQGLPQAIAYSGSAQGVQTAISAQQSVATYYPGSEIFQSRQRGTTVYSGNTGAAAGTGTDSATGQGTLLVAHTSTIYGGGSGVQPGASSATGDTIIGPAGAHTLTVIDTSGTGASGTVSLDGGPPVAFTSATTDLKVSAANGDTVFLNTSAITPGFNGTIPITANGTLSTDGGATATPINFSSNQVVTNSTTGAVTNVDTTNIRRTGTDRLDYQGTADIFQTLMALRDDLRNTQGLPPADQLANISARIGDIDRVHSNLLAVVGQQSASLQTLDAVGQRLQDFQLNAQERVSNTQGADISTLVINFQSQQNLLRLTLAATAQINQVSLLDFLH